MREDTPPLTRTLMTAPAFGHPDRSFYDAARSALNITHPQWAGLAGGDGDVEPSGVNPEITPAGVSVRDEIQKKGDLYGCHQCRTKIANDVNQPWEGDHLPPLGLTAGMLARLREMGVLSDERVAQRVLLPACDICQRYQAELVKRLRNASLDNFGAVLSGFAQELGPRGARWVSEMIGAGRPTGRDLPTNGDSVNATERAEMQAIGAVQGCHVCKVLIPRRVYIADHYPPREFGTHYMPTLCAKLNIKLPEFRFRPHCASCSLAQGAALKDLAAQALARCGAHGIVVYK